jgi:hypothetical protein
LTSGYSDGREADQQIRISRVNGYDYQGVEMIKQQISINTDHPTVTIKASGDLIVRGWGDNSIAVKADQGSFTPADGQADSFELRTNGDCQIDVPAGAVILIRRVGGDAHLENLSAAFTMENVGGDVELVGLVAGKIDRVGGDLIVRKVAGDLSVARVGGDLIGQGLGGYLEAFSIGGDLKIDGATGLRASVGGAAQCRLDALDARGVDLKTGGSLSLAIPSGARVNLTIDARGGNILVDIPGWITSVTSRRLTSARLEGAVEVYLHAGRSVDVTSTGARPNLDGTAAGIGSAQPTDFQENIYRTIDDAVSRTNFSWRMRRDMFERQSRHVMRQEEHILDAVAKADARIQSALNRIDQAAGMLRVDAIPVKPTAPVEVKSAPAPAGNPVGSTEKVSMDDERMLILQMVENKKITVADAEALLDELERQAEQGE